MFSAKDKRFKLMKRNKNVHELLREQGIKNTAFCEKNG
jgi:hypothetical protein